jgi:Protein of unknown function (DUF2752)
MSSIIHWLENHLLTCPYKATMGFDCPGCGIQRAFVELLKGDFLQSFALYPALIPTIITFLLMIVHLTFNLKNGAAFIKYSFIFTVSIVVISYVLKMMQ